MVLFTVLAAEKFGIMSRMSIATVASLLVAVLSGCAASSGAPPTPALQAAPTPEYRIGPGDALQIFVWDQPDLSTTVQVRPDGRISTPLVDDLQAAGLQPTELARQIEARLAEYVRSPIVTVIVQGFVGEVTQQVRVVGQAVQPQALQYRQGMTLLDVIIAVGGLSEFAAGNRARIVREQNGETLEFRVRLNDLLNGDIGENVRMMPGDVLVIPATVL